MNDFAVIGEVDDFGLRKFKLVVEHVDRWLMGRRITLRRWCRVGGDGLMSTRSSGCSVSTLNGASKVALAAKNRSIIRYPNVVILVRIC
jgi:hypothetical protein